MMCIDALVGLSAAAMPYIFMLSLHLYDGYMPPFVLVSVGTFIICIALFVWFPATATTPRSNQEVPFTDLNSHTDQFSIGTLLFVSVLINFSPQLKKMTMTTLIVIMQVLITVT